MLENKIELKTKWLRCLKVINSESHYNMVNFLQKYS